MIFKILPFVSSVASALEPVDQYTWWDSFKASIWPTIILGAFLLVVLLIVIFSIFFNGKNKKK